MKRLLTVFSLPLLVAVFSGVVWAGYAPCYSPEIEIDGICYQIYKNEYLIVAPRDSISVDMMDCYCPPVGGYAFSHKIDSKSYEGDVVIPDSAYVKSLGQFLPVKGIGVCAFAGSPDLRSVTSLGELDYIEAMAFAFCGKLESVDLRFSDKMQRIPTGAFQWCGSLKNFIMPQTISSIHGTPFYESRIEHITIPKTVTRIYNLLYALGGNPDLKSVTCDIADPTLINGSWSPIERLDPSDRTQDVALPEGCVLYVPKESVAKYQRDVRWSCFSEIRAIGDEPSELSEVTVDQSCGASEPVYDLAGRRVGTPRPGQIVIRRGGKSVAR